jgi:hypothetical protein
LIADQLSRLQYKETHESPINDYLRDNKLLKVTDFDPWYANIVNYMVVGYVPLGEDKRKLKYQSISIGSMLMDCYEDVPPWLKPRKS